MDIIGFIKGTAVRLFESVAARRLRQAPKVRTHRPSVEPLEDRVVPSNYYWRPQNAMALDASTAANWVDGNNVPYAVAPGNLVVAC
jgi:hypothetical protein